MATSEHKELAQFLKNVHSSLRQATTKVGAEEAWIHHCSNKNVLKTYARCMETLATKHWAPNCDSDSHAATSRIQWAVDLCTDYFINKSYIQYRERENNIAKRMNVFLPNQESFSEPIKLIDVGSCYNPFKKFQFLDVLALDLCPANDTVFQCDFLQVPIASTNVLDYNNYIVEQLEETCFDVVTFCFLLEYIPSSKLRVRACEKAYSILKPGGLLIINTPDSKHVGANCKIMKCWRYTLALMGFTRIKYEKLKHMHCMAFRKALYPKTASRWADMHKEQYMDYSIHIPQDYQSSVFNEDVKSCEFEASVLDFTELPFYVCTSES